ncbi:MAG: tetratricopeptide repeat protein, partial [Elusimicrobia bacterium]|nr:tetratricopeptide repeat protein [Elusimicrobiota bacterium]
MKKFAAVALLLIAFASASAAFAGADAKATLEQGNQQYEKGDFEGALTSYLSLTRLGFGGPALYYNLGNVYYRKGDRGHAVLWYERAARLDPRDSDVQFNLALARSHIKSEGTNYLERAATYFSENELAVTASLFSIAFFGLLGLAAIGRLKGDVWPALLISLSAAGLLVS